MSNKRILIIDDEETIQTVVQFGIRMTAGWQVLVATSGRQGIQLAQQEQPDVILLDVVMPDMSGMTALKTLQSDDATAHIPVILLTAKAQLTGHSDHARGVRGVITKPFNSLHLSEQIARILQW
ncbi:response regulator [Oscillatoria sp. FACHB-1407]|uniref:response regulator n=1 Tax=Oscillatoria sp. FACHB-1407 TaxID=2692847 RepID=UPI0016884B09|nr:response regulator [Oscillatoria sp. FACHB-1407]MBD2464926.1 response regulator [Oscillatoria sp. FACHB-1407]